MELRVSHSKTFGIWHVLVKGVDQAQVASMVNWCREHVPPNRGECPLYGLAVWSFERYVSGAIFTFGRESDAALFALRWS